MKHFLISTVAVLSLCGPGNVQSFAEEKQTVSKDAYPWIVSPQICRGRPWSSTAKAAGWKVVADSGVCRATANDRSLVAQASPMEGGRFVGAVALHMHKGATIQLFLDEIALDLSDDGQTIGVAGGPEYLKFKVERPKAQRWSEVRIERKQEKLIVTLNGKEVILFADKGRSYDRVGLKPIRGATDINRFSLTGQLVVKNSQKP